MKKRDINFFWLSFTDLMTSLFFVMLVLFVLSAVFSSDKDKEISNLKIELDSIRNRLFANEKEIEFIKSVEKNLEPLKKDSLFFKYEPELKRFTLAFDASFDEGKTEIKAPDLLNAAFTIPKIIDAGRKLMQIVDALYKKKQTDTSFKNVSYLLIISGYASELESNGTEKEEYERSYQRAFNLWEFWRNGNINFESGNLKEIIDLQIAGNGLGGIGRFPKLDYDNQTSEKRNQRFIIQIVPKIGDTKFLSK